jgi:energy-coupling factor transport system ATP-binding protein
MREAICADRVIVMSDGFILADGTPASVFANTDILESAGLDVPDTVKLNRDLGLPMDTLTAEDCSQAIYNAVRNKDIIDINITQNDDEIPNITLPDTNNAILQTENLRHLYSPDTPFETEALKGINFTLYKGTFAGLIGHTGSGKSTFIQHLNGLLKPYSGRVLLNSDDIWNNGKIMPGVRGKVGLVFQYPEYQLFEETVYRDIAFGPRNIKVPESEIDARVREAARFVDLNPELLDKSPFMISGGEKRRAAIAGVIAMRPDVLILDEPTAGLDPAGRDFILRNLKRYHEETGCTMILVTHSMEEIAKYADIIYVFNKGIIEMQGDPDSIFAKAQHLREIGLDVPEITQVILRLNELGLPINPSIHTVISAIREIRKYA